ncbi:Leucine-rich repeat-containing protein 49 [Fasciola gigantica]|uniref:Leucine-rich repeat-containing protein 49 n=1 Tax=Fasciola gigantica TaxID=46835 RepID=A0A504Z7C7_FASGI|nr:Leucine-rich repeat-containing protein 49 [Fasciola gigantica]
MIPACRMSLTTCPALNPEQRCQYLSLQRNRITKIDHLHRLTQLVFLDLSRNQVSLISGLEQLRELRVLLLSQNHIRRIEGLDQQVNLEVLDLQRNGIQKIENLSHMTKLRVLNLAMNEIVFLSGLSGLVSLTEVNLRQNCIVKVEPLSNLPQLNWIQLSFNNIERWSQISGLSKLPSSTKVVLNGNPIVMDPAYRRLMPAQISLAQDINGGTQSSRIFRSAKQTPTFANGQRGLGVITPGHQETDVYEMGLINMHMPNSQDSAKAVTSEDPPSAPANSQSTESGTLAAGDKQFAHAWSTESDSYTPTQGFGLISSGDVRLGTEKKEIQISASCTMNTLKDVLPTAK